MSLNIREKQIKKVLAITMVLNLLCAVLKIWAGQKYNYISLSSSGLESIFDGFGNVILFMAIKFASMPSDENHHYGHYKYENIGSLILSLLLFSSAISLIFEYKDSIITGEHIRSEFGLIPILSIIISMCISLFVTTYEKRQGELLNSKMLLADSNHTFGDLLLSFGVLISILCSYFGWLLPDLIIGFVIIIYLIYLGIKIARNNLDDLLDHSPSINAEFLKDIENIKEVRDVHKFRARGNSHWMNIDFHLLVDADLSLTKAHDISHTAESLLKNRLKSYCQNIDITIHVEPFEKNHKD